MIKPNYTVYPHYVVPRPVVHYNPYVQPQSYPYALEKIPGPKTIYGPQSDKESREGEEEEAKEKEAQEIKEEQTPAETHHSGWSHPYHPSNNAPHGNLYHNH